MGAAAGQTGDRAPDSPHPWKIPPAIWAFVKETPNSRGHRERQVVTAFFIADAEFVACLPPFFSVWRDAAPPRAGLSEQMCEFVAKRAIDLVGAVFAKPQI
jgi:hypothetical protein